jgi:hypothetical protein
MNLDQKTTPDPAPVSPNQLTPESQEALRLALVSATPGQLVKWRPVFNAAPPPVSPDTIAALVAAARMGLDYLQRTNPLEHGNPDLGRTWGALENALEPFDK